MRYSAGARLKSQGKSFEISKHEVWESFRQVKANQGAAGVDGQSIADFEADLKSNLAGQHTTMPDATAVRTPGQGFCRHPLLSSGQPRRSGFRAG